MKGIREINLKILAAIIAVFALVICPEAVLITSYAGSDVDVDFEIYASDLITSISCAVEDRNEVVFDDLEITNGDSEKLEDLFSEEGKVYEIYPEIIGGDVDTDVRIFAVLPEDAKEGYVLTGEEKLAFLYINGGADTVSYSTNVIRKENGEEQSKKTKRIQVKSYERLFGEEETEIVSEKQEAAVISKHEVPRVEAQNTEEKNEEEVLPNFEHDELIQNESEESLESEKETEDTAEAEKQQETSSDVETEEIEVNEEESTTSDTNEAVSDETVSDVMVSDATSSDAILSDETVSDKTVSDATASNATASNAAVSDATASNARPVKPANANNTVGLGYSSTARIYVTTLKALKALRDTSGVYTVKWHVDGEVVSENQVKWGEHPSYEGEVPRIQYGNFAGWATEPNSREYLSEEELPEVKQDMNYYAIFTYEAHFYFKLDGTAPETTRPVDFMYAGPGTGQDVKAEIIVPDGMEVNKHYRLDGNLKTTLDVDTVDELIVTGTTDEAIRTGLKKIYKENYDESWDYDITWNSITFSPYESVDYDGRKFTDLCTVHVDGIAKIVTGDVVPSRPLVPASPSQPQKPEDSHKPPEQVPSDSDSVIYVPPVYQSTGGGSHSTVDYGVSHGENGAVIQTLSIPKVPLGIAPNMEKSDEEQLEKVFEELELELAPIPKTGKSYSVGRNLSLVSLILLIIAINWKDDSIRDRICKWFIKRK